MVHNCIIVSILKFSHAGGGTLCARTIEKSAVVSVLVVNTSAAREENLVDHGGAVQGKRVSEIAHGLV